MNRDSSFVFTEQILSLMISFHFCPTSSMKSVGADAVHLNLSDTRTDASDLKRTKPLGKAHTDAKTSIPLSVE